MLPPSVTLESVSVSGIEIPVSVNRTAVEADLLIGRWQYHPAIPTLDTLAAAKILDPGLLRRRRRSLPRIFPRR